MKIGYVCRAVDPDSFIHATQALWIRALANDPRVSHVMVFARYARPTELPENVSVHSLRKRKGRAGMVMDFVSATTFRGQPDFYFISQGGPYPALLLAHRLLLRRPIYQWKAHAHISPRMRFYAHFCDDLVFTATPSSFPLDIPNRRVVGHGIDVDTFHPSSSPPSKDLALVGRLSPVKRIERALHLIAAAKEQGLAWSLDVIGPEGASDYVSSLLELTHSLRIQDQVSFVGPVPHASLAARLPTYRACLSFSQGALDKTSVEAMASGVPVLTTNSATLEAIPKELRAQLHLPECDVARQQQLVRQQLEAGPTGRSVVGATLRSSVIANHSLGPFFGKILDCIDDHQRAVRG